MEQYDMERRLRFLFWDKFGLLHHVPPVDSNPVSGRLGACGGTTSVGNEESV